MKTIPAFFRLIRFPNLVFIAISQLLFFYFIPVACSYFLNKDYRLIMVSDTNAFYWMLAASITIAAAGYIINDYFDISMDMVNRPATMVLEKKIKRRWAILLHFLISLIGIICSFMASRITHQWMILFGNVTCVVLLWFYSTHFKKMLLTGNVVIALLTAWVFVVMYFLLSGMYLPILPRHISSTFFKSFIFKVVVGYSAFAFMLTLIREAVKDMEDMIGDADQRCKTMPIVWGIPVTKIYTAVWMVVCAAAVGINAIYLFIHGWWFASVYMLMLIALPLLRSILKLKSAELPKHYHTLSRELKFIMLAGILTMIFFKFIQ